MSNRNKYRQELEALPLGYKHFTKQDVIERTLNAIDELGSEVEEKINKRWKTTAPVSGVVGLSLDVLLTYEHYVLDKGSDQKVLNNKVLESNELNISKATKTIKALKKAQVGLREAQENIALTIGRENHQRQFVLQWGRMIADLDMQIKNQELVKDEAKETQRRLKLKAMEPVFLFVQSVASVMLHIKIPPVKARDNNTKLTPIVRFLNALTGEDVSQAQDAVRNIYYGNKSNKGFIFKGVDKKKY